jgi:hypothetical protein
MLQEKDRDFVAKQGERYKKRKISGTEKKPLTTSDRVDDHRFREKVEKSIDDLVWLMDHWPPDQQSMVFTPQRIEKFATACLTSHFDKESDSDAKERIKRQYEIAAVLAERGAAMCLEAFERKEKESPPNLGMDSPLYDLVRREAATTIDLLNYVATGRRGVRI